MGLQDENRENLDNALAKLNAAERKKSLEPRTAAEPPDLSAIDTMPAEALRELIRRVSGAIWGIGIMTNKQRLDAMKLKIASIALTAKDNQVVLKACNDFLDREEGKAVQRIDQTATMRVTFEPLVIQRIDANAAIKASNEVLEGIAENVTVIEEYLP